MLSGFPFLLFSQLGSVKLCLGCRNTFRFNLIPAKFTFYGCRQLFFCLLEVMFDIQAAAASLPSWFLTSWGFDNGLGFGKCMEKECSCLVSKGNLTWLAASGISELPRGAADILHKLFPLSWYIKQLCSAAKKLIWSCLRNCDKLVESFPFSFRLRDDFSALCGKFCFFI